MLFPLIALDLWYAARISRAETLQTLIGGNLVASSVFVTADLPLIAGLMAWPRVNSATLPAMIVMSLVAGPTAARFGGRLGTLERQTEQIVMSSRARRLLLGGFALAVALALVIALTAQPPTT